MALTKDKLDKFLSRTNVDSGALYAWYGFNEWSGHVLFNEKHEDTKNTSVISVGANSGCVNGLSAPLYLVGSGANSFSFSTGSGHFDSNSVFKLGDKFITGGNGFTIIVNLGNSDDTQNLDKGKTLFTSMENANDTSGFAVGINGLNRAYFHYAGVDGKVDRSISAKNELNDYCVFSVACKPYYSYTEVTPTYSRGVKIGETKRQVVNPSRFDYAYHDVTNINPNAPVSWSTTSCDGCVNFSASDSFYIGDFYTPSDGYTGYKGHIVDILIFSGALQPEQRHEISKAFFVENIVPASFSQRDIQQNAVTGSGVASVQITGTGITGYENVEIVSNISTRDGGLISGTCTTIKSGIRGPLSGEVTTFETSTGIVNRTVVEFVPEIMEYSAADYAPYSKNALVFYEPIDSNDVYELHSYTGRSDRINRQTLIDVVPATLDWKKTPVQMCREYSSGLCTAQSWTGKVCYPCNKYTGEAACGGCYKITGTVDGPCGEDDTCASGMSSIEDCRAFVFDECMRRTDSPVGNFDLKRTFMPNPLTFNPYIDAHIDDVGYITSGGNLFINGILSKPGKETCKTEYRFNEYGTRSSNLTETCSIHSGKYLVKHGHNGVYSGLHSFDIWYRYDYYDSTGHRLFVDDYKYVSPSDEFAIYDDSLDDGLNNPTGEGLFLKYVSGSSNLTFSGTDYIKRDIYLNGQKLISGLNYVGASGNKVTLLRSTLPAIEDAQLAFITAPIYANRLTGSNAGGYKDFEFNLLSERIWVNGMRQAEGIDYMKVSDASKLAGTVLKSKPAIIYGDYQNFFNDEIQTGFKV